MDFNKDGWINYAEYRRSGAGKHRIEEEKNRDKNIGY